MDAATKGQVTRGAADIYEEFFVPALFAEWPPRLCDAAALGPGQRVLDVACGTGVLAREALDRVGAGGAVTGLDCNDGMLAVAGRREDGIAWRPGRAESLPFPDGAFDAVVSQFGLMFFDDRAAALREMWRVLRPGGRLAVAVWGALDQAPGYAAMTGLLQRLFGDDVADALRAPYVLGGGGVLEDLFADAGLGQARIETHVGRAVFPSIADWVRTDVKGWTLADMIDEDQYRDLRGAAQRELTAFVAADGTVRFPHPAHIAVAEKG